jgi:hypothetical protein
MKNALAFFLKISVSSFLFCVGTSSFAEVEGTCTLCHKYPGLGKIQKRAEHQHDRLRIFYINNELFDASYHGKIRCASCHTGVDKVPHIDLESVDCGTSCHILDPAVNRSFSHKNIVDDLRMSAHGEEGSKHPDKGDLPVCKDCHSNKTYHKSVELQEDAKVIYKVCRECHQSDSYIKHFYEHITYRTVKRRSSKEVVKLCSACHADQDLMAKHELDAVVGFSSTFHAKAIAYSDENVANCLSCHAPYQMGFSPHRITSRKDKSSPVNIDNKSQTCSQANCHQGAISAFATVVSREHQSPKRSQLLVFADTNLVSVEKTKMSTEAPAEESIEEPIEELAEDFLGLSVTVQAMVIYGINLFYKLIIIAVIGFFVFHRLLCLYSSTRNHEPEGELK